MFKFIRNTIGGPINFSEPTLEQDLEHDLKHDLEDLEDLEQDLEQDSEFYDEETYVSDEENSEDSNDTLLEKYGKLLDISQIGDGIESKLYKIKMSDYTSFSESWNMNRGVDESHVDKLYTDLKLMKCPNFIGTIKAVRTNSTIRTIDGQHRELAFKKLRNENIQFDMSTYLEVYTCENISDIETIKIFENANKNKPITELDMPELKYKKVIDTLREDPVFNNMIVDKDDKVVLAPRITYKNFYNKMQVNMKDKDYTVEQIVEAIINKNKEFMDMKRWTFMGGIAGKEIAKDKIMPYEKAQKSHFYLHMPKSKYPIDKWMKAL